ncbi:MAG: flagellar motor switch protein FliG [Syntrophorhabdaceae bacterium]|nr:flagellar motor switch protein FliG [Syntrophorhabdaceae bacterium]
MANQQQQQQQPQLSGQEKSAIMISLIGEEAAAEVLKNLDMHDVGKITAQMSRMKTIQKETADVVLREIIAIIFNEDVQLLAGEEYIKNVLMRGFSAEDASKVMERASKDDPLDALREIAPWALANILMGEHPQTIAFILCLLEPVNAAEVLSMLNEELRTNVAMRIAVTERIPETAIEEIRDVFDSRMMGMGKSGIKVGGMKAIAEILNHSDRTTEESVFTRLEEKDKTLAESIRELMFVFDDIITIDDRSIQLILKEVGTDDLSMALKTAPDELKTKIFKNMSQRAAEILKEEIATKGPVKVSDVEKAQLKVLGVTRKLEQEGKIVIGRGAADAVVV